MLVILRELTLYPMPQRLPGHTTATYSQDLRDRVIAYVEAGNTQLAAAKTFSITAMTVCRWMRAYRKDGRKTPLQRGGYKKTRIDIDKLKEYMQKYPSKPIKEVSAALGIKLSTLYSQLQKLGYKRKKKSFTYREADPEKRQVYLQALSYVPAERQVYLDESGIALNMVQEWCWAPRGVIIAGHRSGKHRKRLNVIGALVGGKSKALASFTGSCTSAIFYQWVKEHLLKVLKRGQVVVLDNASFHKCAKALQLIESVGCQVLFLPPYSPDYNPIEHLWANMKRFLKYKMNQIQEQYDRLIKELSRFFKAPIPLMN